MVNAPSIDVDKPNDLWTVDFKGWWNAKEGARCKPLTVRDACSRYILGATLLESSSAENVRNAFKQLFDSYGLPKSILVDNGPPFATIRARLGMTTLSAWWVSLGIRGHRSRPGHPQDNGGHERMHLDMRYDVEDFGAETRAQQQTKLDGWRHDFNHIRPHEALGQRTPGEFYRRSSRVYRGSRAPQYPGHLVIRKVQSTGRVRYCGEMLRVGGGFRGYNVAIESISQHQVRIYFYDLD